MRVVVSVRVASTGQNSGTITNVNVTSGLVSAGNLNGIQAGGLVGQNQAGATITQSASAANVTVGNSARIVCRRECGQEVAREPERGDRHVAHHRANSRSTDNAAPLGPIIRYSSRIAAIQSTPNRHTGVRCM